jgi:hypothetical protein
VNTVFGCSSSSRTACNVSTRRLPPKEFRDLGRLSWDM